ncbi:unnamed protein product [Cunninghamella echinulata]
MSIHDFLNYVAPADPFVSHYRVLREATPHSYMVIMTFRNEEAGQDYYKQYNNRKFSSMEDEVCQVVYLKSILIKSKLISPLIFHSNYEDNNCPVCLEHMDESITGLLTISCQHTFHAHCISKWGGESCPVCRYSQNRNQQDSTSTQKQLEPFSLDNISNSFQDGFSNQCQTCGIIDNLWICLVCGQISCGRENQGHALEHYQSTSHLYALEIETQRVWDYASDGYVHRLIQNVVDGKLVELPSHINQNENDDNTEELSEMAQGKLNAMSLEYSYLLTSQLDSQRIYYEDRMKEVIEQLSLLTDQCKLATNDLENIRSDNKKLADENNESTQRLSSNHKEVSKLEQKIESWKDKIESTTRKYLEEKELAASLSSNNAMVKKDIDTLQQNIDLLTKKSMELMAVLESQNEIAPTEETASSSS